MKDLDKLMNDTIDIFKKNGQKFTDIKAYVGNVIICLGNILIEPGDVIQRKMSNGGRENYQVLDPCFHEAIHGLPAHYQIRHRKLDIIEANNAIQHINYTITGDNAHINQNSVDNSINILKKDDNISNLLEKIIEEIKKSTLNDIEKQNSLEVVEVIKSQYASGKWNKHIISTLLKSLPTIQSITSIVSNIGKILGIG